MRFAAFLPTYWDDYGTSSLPVAIKEAAQAAETLGYEGVWAIDVMSREYVQVSEPLVTLASLVHLVPRLTLGTAVLVLPYRNALLVAKRAAALDMLSHHRLILGVGIGWKAEEFALLGANFEHRGVVTDEAIEVMRTLWREPSASYHGRFHRFDDASLPPHPVDGGPPIWSNPTRGQIRRWLAALCHGPGRLPIRGDRVAGAGTGVPVPDVRQRALFSHREVG